MSAYFLFLDPVKEAENAILPDIIKDTLDRLEDELAGVVEACLLYTSPSPRDQRGSRMPSSA